MKRFFLFTLALCGCLKGTTAVPNIVSEYGLIPAPKEIEITQPHKMPLLDVKVHIEPNADLPPEGYTLVTNRRRATITAKDEQGAIWARQTLRQLIDEKGLVPYVKITDWPAFSIRAFMHDVGRNFLTIETLKQHLDILSQYKINVFHWHLTDYPAWRIESRAYPELNDPDAHRADRDQGKFYTYGEIKSVIAYARQKGIMVIPEIDMPGHSTYFNTVFGFQMNDPRGMKVLETLLDEFFGQISADDAPYIHIGSDEVHIDNQQEFMQWADSLVRAHDRIPMVWDPGLKPAEGTIRQVWSDRAARSAEHASGGPFVDSYMGYLNYYDPLEFVSRMYLHTPCGRDHGDETALGGILCLWNDVRVADKQNIIRHNGAWPGLLSFAERFWVGAENERNRATELMPDPDSPTGQALREFEKRMVIHRDKWLAKESFYWQPNAALRWQVSEPVATGTDPAGVRRHELFSGTINLDAFVNEKGLTAAAPCEVWAETVLTVPRDTVITAWVGFETPARSNRKSVGIGREGEWEAGGRVWVNGETVGPPQWKEPGKYAFHFDTWHKPEEEIPYTDEQFYWTRQPVSIALKAGDNTVVLCAPKVFEGQRWGFAFIPF